MSKRKTIVAVIGGRECTKEVEQLTLELAKKLAKVADILVCGGLVGVMEHACCGFKAGGGVTLGIIPGYDKEHANEFVDIVIPSGLGLARNVLVVKSARSGTLSEVAYCLQFSIPVISFNSWDIPGVIKTKTIEQTIEEVRKRLK
ncbi:MAG: TIGR00725 family protein [Candidatus Omnitrophica bacterium]|nr:TIGR00725 family protein [Candidatus Omnitrophota bacterium]